MQVRMRRRIVGMWPKQGEERHTYSQSALVEGGQDPFLDKALASLWWRWAGHLARQDAMRDGSNMAASAVA